MKLKVKLQSILWPHNKIDFISKLNPNSNILDVGCGNNSPHQTKRLLPDCKYTGIDVGDYNQTKPNHADKYIGKRSRPPVGIPANL